MVATTKVFVSLFSDITMAAAKVATNANILSPKSSFQLFVVPPARRIFSPAIVDAVISDQEKKSDESLCQCKSIYTCLEALSDHLTLMFFID